MSCSSPDAFPASWLRVLLSLILLSALSAMPVLGENLSENMTTLATYENGTVTAEWVVDFYGSPVEGYPPLCVRFTVDGPLGDYYWDFGDGSTSMVRNPVHCYQKQGSYWVKVKYFVGSISGEIVKESFIIVKDPTTFVDFRAEPSNGTVPLTVQFSLIGEPTNIIWDFDDGGESTEFNPRHQYTSPGLYTPVLTYCVDGSCQKMSKYNFIQVNEGNEVNFTADRLDGFAPLSTKFFVSGPAETWSWDFGDGTTSYEKDPRNYYTEPGLYTVSLTYSIDGATYTITRPDYITVRSRISPDFTATTRNGTAPLCVEFDMINRPKSWLWHFGDNTTSSEEHGSHCYGVNGTYDIRLEYCSHGLCEHVVKEGYITVQAPGIYAVPGKDPATLQFTTDAGDGLQYFWDFGDMTTSGGAAPEHRYEEPGVYNVTLSVLGICGCNAKTATTVTVDPKKPLDFTATPVQGCAPHCVQFSEISPAIPITRLWDFGDMEMSEEKNPFHCYQFPGVYEVILRNEYPDHEEHVTRPNLITVYAVPRPLFSVNPPNGVAPVTITFTDETQGYESKRFWDFGDGTTAYDARTDHLFTTPGVYNVSLTVWGEGDCHGTISQDIHVLEPEVIRYDLTGLPRRGIAPVCTSFQVTGSPYQWTIDFGDGQSTSDELNPFHCYESPGVYSPELEACDATGCEKICKPGYIVALPTEYETLTLAAGWNLISIPLCLEPGKDTLSLFSEIDTAGHSIFAWESASRQWVRMGADDPLTPLTGIWIYSSGPATVSLPLASRPEGNLTTPLATGWNLLSFPAVELTPASVAFPPELDWSYLLWFDAETQQYQEPVEKKGPDAGRLLDPRHAFWVYMNGPGIFIAPAL